MQLSDHCSNIAPFSCFTPDPGIGNPEIACYLQPREPSQYTQLGFNLDRKILSRNRSLSGKWKCQISQLWHLLACLVPIYLKYASCEIEETNLQPSHMLRFIGYQFGDVYLLLPKGLLHKSKGHSYVRLKR